MAGKRNALDYVPEQLTKAFRLAQSDERFQGWLKMQEASMEIEFPIYDVPQLRGQMYTPDSLAIVEAELLQLHPNHREAFTEDAVHLTMRFAYYIGETFRRAFEGTWVAIPSRVDPENGPRTAAVDFPMREAYIDPAQLVVLALNRRTGKEISRVFGYAERDYAEWIESGKPERTFLGRLRED